MISKYSSLSKSRIMAGLQCEKALYLTVHQPKLAAPTSEAQQAIFDQGKEIGKLACEKFPGGIAIEAPYWNTGEGVSLTKKAIQDGANAIYEATFEDNGVHCRVDILHRSSARAKWRAYEVKSSTSVKPEHIYDVAVQGWVLENAGLSWSDAFLVHLNSNCRYPDLSNLFVEENLTKEVRERIVEIPDIVDRFRKMLSQNKEPRIDIGPHCDSPYECPFKDHCWKHVPDFSVFDLPGSAWKLYQKGVLKLEDVDVKSVKGLTKKALEVCLSGKRDIDKKGIRQAVKAWEYPLYYLDFETASPAVPRYEDTGPYANVPIQYSLHIQLNEGSPTEHLEYLHGDKSDPRPMIARKLTEDIGDRGSVVAYYSSFEKGVLESLAERFPEYREKLQSVISRLVDPHPLFKEYVYDKHFRGSFSLKLVAPAILGEQGSYEGMEVSDGKAAQRVFEKVIADGIMQDEKEKLRRSLLDYCRKDTLLMVNLVDWLKKA